MKNSIKPLIDLFTFGISLAKKSVPVTFITFRLCVHKTFANYLTKHVAIYSLNLALPPVMIEFCLGTTQKLYSLDILKVWHE